MAITESKHDREKTINKLRDKKPYFCPHCGALFTDKTNYKIQKNVSNNYKCLVCESHYFDHDAYDSVKKSAPPYHIKGNNDKKEVTLFIKRTVMGLKKDGFTHKEIQEITHFPRSMINNITKIHSKADKSMSLETFLQEHLRVKDDEMNNIVKAIQYGCSYDLIGKIFDVPRRTVMQAGNTYKKLASAQDKKDTDTFKKNYTIKLEDDKNIVITEK